MDGAVATALAFSLSRKAGLRQPPVPTTSSPSVGSREIAETISICCSSESPVRCASAKKMLVRITVCTADITTEIPQSTQLLTLFLSTCTVLQSHPPEGVLEASWSGMGCGSSGRTLARSGHWGGDGAPPRGQQDPLPGAWLTDEAKASTKSGARSRTRCRDGAPRGAARSAPRARTAKARTAEADHDVAPRGAPSPRTSEGRSCSNSRTKRRRESGEGLRDAERVRAGRVTEVPWVAAHNPKC
jgi:hypothetical protein